MEFVKRTGGVENPASGLPPEREVTKFRPSEPNALASGLAVPSSIPLTPDASANGSHGVLLLFHVKLEKL